MRVICGLLASGLVLGAPVPTTLAAETSAQAAADAPIPPPPTVAWGDDAIERQPGDPLLRSATRARVAGAVYDVHVYALSTPTRSLALAEAEARNLLQVVSDWYAAQLGVAAPTFRLTSFTTMAAPGEGYCGLRVTENVVGTGTLGALRPTSGATDATWLILSPEISDTAQCTMAGQGALGAHGAWAQYSPTLAQRGFVQRTLVHEFGHNLGLNHSARVYSRGAQLGWQGDGLDQYKEYGDQSDPMGGVTWEWDASRQWWTVKLVNMQAHHRNLLTAFAPTAIASVGRGQTVTISLAPVGAASGTRVIYLPLFNRAKFALDYRSAQGPDAALVKDRTHEAPGAGVYLRLINSGADRGPTAFDPVGGLPGILVGTASWTAEQWVVGSTVSSARQAFVTGERATLPDGSTVAIGALTSASAQVTITRPADSAAPTFTAPATLSGCPSAFTSGQSCSLTTAGSATSIRTTLGMPTITDDVWVTSAVVSVDGSEVSRRVSPSPGILGERNGLAEGLAQRGSVSLDLPAGTHTVQVAATDLAGNTASVTATVSVTVPGQPAPTLPGAPQGLTWTQTGRDAIQLSWRPPASNGGRAIDRYWTERSYDGGITWLNRGYALGTSITPQGLPLGLPILFRVAAATTAGVGPWAQSGEIHLSSARPSPPLSVQVTPGDRSAIVVWEPPLDEGGSPIDGYTATSSAGDTCTSTGTDCEVTGLVNGTAYTFTVTATNAAGESAPSLPSEEVVPAGLPQLVSNIRGVVAGRSLRVTWSDPVDTGGMPITGYRYRIGTARWRFTDTPSATVRLPPPGAAISFRVQAGNVVGFGASATARLRGR